MTKIDELMALMQRNSYGIRFSDLCRIRDHFFGEPRQKKSSHRIYKMSWRGDLMVTIQNIKVNAKAYQVKQALSAIEKLEVGHGTK